MTKPQPSDYIGRSYLGQDDGEDKSDNAGIRASSGIASAAESQHSHGLGLD